MSHETWQLVNGFECLLTYIVLDIKDFFQFISLTNSFTQIYFTLKSIFYKMTAMLYFLLFSLVWKNLTNYGRRHLKLFTNCHVSWDTLYIHCLVNSKYWFTNIGSKLIRPQGSNAKGQTTEGQKVLRDITSFNI